jgi:GAF domain-containing protein
LASTEGGHYRTIYELAATINSTLDSQEVLRSIAESTTRAMGAKATSLMLLSPDRRELHHRAAFGLSDAYVHKGPLDVDRSMSEALRGEPVAIRDAGTDPRVQYKSQATQEGIASILSVPMRLRSEVIGVMRVYTAEPRDFSADDVEFVGAVANLGAIALENARRFEQIRSNYDALRQDLLEWYTASR